MNLNISLWKTFTIKKLFPKLVVGSANQGMLSEGSDCFYVGAKRNDNGVMLHCQRDEDLILKGNCIIFICNGEGSVGYANYMDRDFIGTTDIVAGYNENLNYLNGVFLATVISKERPKYSFGRKWKTHLKDTVIKLPAKCDDNGYFTIDNSHKYSSEGYIPDWQFMENYIKSLHHKPLTTKNKNRQRLKLNEKEWKEFFVGGKYGIFSCSTTPLSIKDALDDGNCPLVSRTANNNGIDGYFNIDTDKLSRGNCITVGAEGIYAFYQPQSFGSGNKVYTLRHKKLNKYNALFITTILNKEDYKYSYGRARVKGKLEQEKIRLPAVLNPETHEYVPDWQFMENYIKSLPYGDRI